MKKSSNLVRTKEKIDFFKLIKNSKYLINKNAKKIRRKLFFDFENN